MKVFHMSEAELNVVLEGLDDLWYLENILHPEDQISALVKRRVEKQADMTRSKETDRKPVKVLISIEKIEFQPFSDRIRILGSIVSGIEDAIGEHQSAIFKPGDLIEIKKESWLPNEKRMLEDSVRQSGKVSEVFVCLDDEEANIFVMLTYGIQFSGRIESGRSGKYFDSDYNERDYFENIAKALSHYIVKEMRITIIGPGFTKDGLSRYLKEKKEFSGIQITTASASRTDEGAVYEYIDSPEGKKAMSLSRLTEEQSVLDDFLKLLKTGNMAVYGDLEIRNAASLGAIEKLILSDDEVRNESNIELINMITGKGGKISVVSSHGNPGKTIKGFGGKVAILRYPVS